MATFYSNDDRRRWFSAPQYVRQRHRYRGVRESEKMNLEMDQFAFSVRNLYGDYNEFRETIADYAGILREGQDPLLSESGAVLYYSEAGGPEQVVRVAGVHALAARLGELRKRLDYLESA